MKGQCYDIFIKPFEWAALNRARRELIAPLQGRVLEIGSGTGANFSFYSTPELVTASEPDPAMLRVSQSIKPSGLVLENWKAESLALPDQSVDHIVSTLVLCSVRDLTRCSVEFRRVLKPEGRLHLIEHVKGCGFPGRLHELCTPIWSKICGGCHLNRATISCLSQAGFDVVEERVVLNFLGTPFIFARLAMV